MTLVRCSTQIPKNSWWRQQVSKSLNESFKGGLWDSSYTLKSSETMIRVSFPITSNAVLLIRIRIGYVSEIILWILLQPALWPIGNVHAATQRLVNHCEDGMYWLDCYSSICVVGVDFWGTLEGGRMGDNLEFFGEVFGLFLVFCLLYYYIIHIDEWRPVMRVHDTAVKYWDSCFWESQSGSDTTQCMAIM